MITSLIHQKKAVHQTPFFSEDTRQKSDHSLYSALYKIHSATHPDSPYIVEWQLEIKQDPVQLEFFFETGNE